MSKGKAQFACGGHTCKLTGRSKHVARWHKTDANVRPRGGNGLEMGIYANGTVISVPTFHRDKEYVPMRFSYL